MDKPNVEYVAQLKRFCASLQATHESLIKLESAAIAILDKPGPEWLATCSDDQARRGIGKIQAALQYITQRVQHILSLNVAKDNEKETMEKTADLMASGMTDFAMACPCGTCQFCQMKRGAAAARPKIYAAMRATFGVQEAKRVIMPGDVQ